MTRDGLFVVIEGLDSSGKHTQADLLVDRLEAADESAKMVEFPTHGETRIGRVIDDYLHGDYDVAPEVRALLYAADRYQYAAMFREFLADGGVLVADRYSASNYAFQTTHLEGGEWEDLLAWMETVESRLPEPDLTIFLDVDPATARSLMADRDRDVHEDDLDFQEAVAANYRRLAGRAGWTTIDCVEESELRPIDAIHEDIWDLVEPRL